MCSKCGVHTTSGDNTARVARHAWQVRLVTEPQAAEKAIRRQYPGAGGGAVGHVTRDTDTCRDGGPVGRGHGHHGQRERGQAPAAVARHAGGGGRGAGGGPPHPHPRGVAAAVQG